MRTARGFPLGLGDERERERERYFKKIIQNEKKKTNE
jgi:hypothetical protein